jgi:hypothetical protein
LVAAEGRAMISVVKTKNQFAGTANLCELRDLKRVRRVGERLFVISMAHTIPH